MRDDERVVNRDSEAITAMLASAQHEQQALAATTDTLRATLAATGGDPSQLDTLNGALASVAELTAELRRAAAAPGSLSPLQLAQMQASLAVTLQSAGAAARTAQAEVATKAAEATARAVELASATAATRAEVQALSADLFDRKMFDSYLHFAAPEDEAAYRDREAERKRYIEEQQAKHTPQGELNAAGATAGQMLDAHAHGGGDSPEWLPRWNKLTDTIHSQRAALVASGQSTAEYDEHIRKDVTRFLKDKGLSDDQVRAALAANADPLDAVKPYLGKDRDARTLEKGIRYTSSASANPPDARKDGAAPPSTPTAPTIDAIGADMKAAGMTVSEVSTPGHGLHGVAIPQATPQHSPA